MPFIRESISQQREENIRDHNLLKDSMRIFESQVEKNIDERTHNILDDRMKIFDDIVSNFGSFFNANYLQH